MKRTIRHVLLHIVAAACFWGAAFHFFYSDKHSNYDVDSRDLRYVEHLELSHSGGMSKEQLALMSRFLFMHLSERREAVVRLTLSGIDAGVTYSFFVEKDSAGQWVISISSKDCQAFEDKSEYKRPFKHYPTAYSVERVILGADGALRELNVPKDGGDHDYYLVFMDQEHKPIDLGLLKEMSRAETPR